MAIFRNALKGLRAAQRDPVRKRQQHYTLKWSTTTMVTALLNIPPRSRLNLVNKPEQKEDCLKKATTVKMVN